MPVATQQKKLHRLPEKKLLKIPDSSNVVDKQGYFLSGNVDLCNKLGLCIKHLKWFILIPINGMQKLIMIIPKLLMEMKLLSLTGTRDRRG
jgi:hypothetical protein